MIVLAPIQTRTILDAQTPRNRLPPPADIARRSERKSADSSADPRQQVDLVGRCEVRTLPVTRETVSPRYRMALRGHPQAD